MIIIANFLTSDVDSFGIFAEIFFRWCGVLMMVDDLAISFKIAKLLMVRSVGWDFF